MATSPAKDIADFLQTQGVGTVGTDIFVGKMPPDISQNMTVYDTGGLSPNPKWLRDEPTVQVMVRGDERDYEATYTLALDVKNALLGCSPTTINSKSYVFFNMLGDITFLKHDQSERPMFSLNFRLVVENDPNGTRTTF